MNWGRTWTCASRVWTTSGVVAVRRACRPLARVGPGPAPPRPRPRPRPRPHPHPLSSPLLRGGGGSHGTERRRRLAELGYCALAFLPSRPAPRLLPAPSRGLTLFRAGLTGREMSVVSPSDATAWFLPDVPLASRAWSLKGPLKLIWVATFSYCVKLRIPAN